MIVNRSELYFRHLVIAIYLSASEMMVRGALRQHSELFESLAVFVIQGWIYVVPLFLMFTYPLKCRTNFKAFKILLLVQLIYLMLVVAPQNIINGTYGLLFKGVKAFYLPLFIYFYIFAYLAENLPKFEERFLSHIVRVGMIAGAFIVIEVFLLYTGKGASYLTYFRQISINFQEHDLDTIRPLGMFLGHHFSGLFFALLSVITYNCKNKLIGCNPRHLFYFFVMCLFVTTAKTFITAFLVYYILSVVLSFNARRYFEGVVIVAFLVAFALLNKELTFYFISDMFTDSHSRHRMLDKFTELQWFIKNSIIPNGFLPEGLGEKEGIYVDPIYEDNEIYAYKFAYRVGIIGFLMWTFTVFRPLYTFRIRRVIMNSYCAIFFVCAFGFLHYLPMFSIFIFSIIIYAYTMLNTGDNKCCGLESMGNNNQRIDS